MKPYITGVIGGIVTYEQAIIEGVLEKLRHSNPRVRVTLISERGIPLPLEDLEKGKHRMITDGNWEVVVG